MVICPFRNSLHSIEEQHVVVGGISLDRLENTHGEWGVLDFVCDNLKAQFFPFFQKASAVLPAVFVAVLFFKSASACPQLHKPDGCKDFIHRIRCEKICFNRYRFFDSPVPV